MNRYQEMQVFAAVAQTGSLAAAARHLNLAPATITRTLAALEARLGTVLLLRSPRGASLSPAGERFAASCRLILEEIAEAEHSAAGIHRHPAGPLTVSLPLLLTHQVFMPIALDYLNAFPDVQLRTRTRESLPKLLEEGIDVAFVVGHLPDSSGFAVLVGHVAPIICAAPGYLSRWGRPDTPDALKDHRSVLATSMGDGADWRLHGNPSSRAARTAPVLTCTTQQAAIRAAVAGLGLVRCMSYEAHEELHSGLLEPVLEAFAAPELPAQLIYREGRKACTRVRTFLDFAVPRLRSHPAFRP